jgi:hypothetical protein
MAGRVAQGEVVLTLDLDWAPDVAIDFVSRELVQRGVRATWLVTHRSAAVERLEEHSDLFELGIHPNFLPGSTHGSTLEGVLDHCMGLVSGAVTMRTHGLYQSSMLLDLVLERTPLEVDLSLFLPRANHVAPVLLQRAAGRLVRIPYVWEDDFEMDCRQPSWQLEPLLAGQGLKVLDLHPVHVFLNSPTMDNYRLVKSLRQELHECRWDELQRLMQPGDGPRTFFLEVVDHLAAAGTSSLAREVAARWLADASEQ